MPEQADLTQIYRGLGELSGKMDVVLAGQTRNAEDMKELVSRISKVESEIIALKTEKTTSEKHRGAVWAFVVAIGSLAVSAWSAIASRLPL